MDIKRLEIYHTPTEKSVICLCLNTDQFTVDCEQYIIDREYVLCATGNAVSCHNRV